MRSVLLALTVVALGSFNLAHAEGSEAEKDHTIHDLFNTSTQILAGVFEEQGIQTNLAQYLVTKGDQQIFTLDQKTAATFLQQVAAKNKKLKPGLDTFLENLVQLQVTYDTKADKMNMDFQFKGACSLPVKGRGSKIEKGDLEEVYLPKHMVYNFVMKNEKGWKNPRLWMTAKSKRFDHAARIKRHDRFGHLWINEITADLSNPNLYSFDMLIGVGSNPLTAANLMIMPAHGQINPNKLSDPASNAPGQQMITPDFAGIFKQNPNLLLLGPLLFLLL